MTTDSTRLIQALPVCLPPWRENPYRLVSLLAMLRFYVDRYNRALDTLFYLRDQAGRYKTILDMDRNSPEGWKTLESEARDHIRSKLTDLHDVFRSMDLVASYKAVERLRDNIKPERHFWELQGFTDDIYSRMNDELEEQLCFFLFPSKSQFYEKPLAGWEKALVKFPASNFDIEEAGKCMAVERHTAAVFHLMRVTELGVLALEDFLDEPDHKAHFGSGSNSPKALYTSKKAIRCEVAL